MSRTNSFSIVIPCLNEEKALPRLLRNLSAQNYSGDFEVLVVDGQSQDKTVEKAKAFRGKLKKLRTITSKVKNVSHQRNLGAEKSKYDWLVFLDADTQILPDFLSQLNEAIEAYSFDCFTCLILEEAENVADKIMIRTFNIGALASTSLKQHQAWGSCMGCRKEIFLKEDGFNPDVSFQEDGELARRLVKRGYKFKVLSSPKFIMSLRRFEKKGKINVIRNAALLQLKNSLIGFDKSFVSEKLYPMTGGELYYQTNLSRFSNRELLKKMSLDQLRSMAEFRQLLNSKSEDLFQKQIKKVNHFAMKVKDKLSIKPFS